MNQVQFISSKLQAPVSGIAKTLELLAADCTIPFIARYRKDATGNLDEEAIEAIAKLGKQFDTVTARREAILKSISEQGQLTPELSAKISASFDLTELEDLYLPFKKRRKTRADVARENGLEPLAKIIMAQNRTDLESAATKLLSKNVPDIESALQGARDIIAEWINENPFVRRQIRRLYQNRGVIATKVVTAKKETEEAVKFKQYFDWSEPLLKAPAHRLLAMLRAEAEGIVRLKISIEQDDALSIIEKAVLKSRGECADEIMKAADDSFKRLLAPSLSGEVLTEAKQKADLASIKVFAANLSQLLMAAPLGSKRILAIDPGFRSGCKVVCLDEQGDLLYNETVFPHPPQAEKAMAGKKIKSMVNAYKIEAIAIGNGTASRETEDFVRKIPFDRDLQVFVVSEAGASVYSASKIAREEFPAHDVTVRGAVSIGRRLADPLAELVKIDPKAIGVGQYQHDVDQELLRDELDATVIRCVNNVGVNLNTASRHLLSYVSGIGEKLAGNIIEYRTANGAFQSRRQLQEVPRLGPKAFQQAAGFLRIREGEDPLENSAVHPEAYALVRRMASALKVSVRELVGNAAVVQKIVPEDFVTDEFGLLYIRDVIQELKKPGNDPRKAAALFEFDSRVRTIQDLHQGMILTGIVNNITNFGCFVDIGIKESGLVHISQLKAGFVRDVNEVVKLHQHVQVKVTSVDVATKRVALSMIIS